MIHQLFIGGLLIGLTVIIHAVALDYIIHHVRRWEKATADHLKHSRKAIILGIVVLCVFFAHIVEIWVWALFYMIIGAFDPANLETALYFSTSAFTTVGFGDIVLNQNWRLISSFESANGFMLFGWSTAFIFEIMSKLYRREGQTIEKS